jgi:hypothetical protein
LSDLPGELLALDGGVLNGDTRSPTGAAGDKASDGVSDRGDKAGGLLGILGLVVRVGIGGGPRALSSGKSWEMGLGCVRRKYSPPVVLTPPFTSSSINPVDFGRVCLGDREGGGGGGGGGVFPTQNFGAGDVGRLGAPSDGLSTPRSFPLLSATASGTSRINDFGGECGDSTRNDGGEHGG